MERTLAEQLLVVLRCCSTCGRRAELDGFARPWDVHDPRPLSFCSFACMDRKRAELRAAEGRVQP